MRKAILAVIVLMAVNQTASTSAQQMNADDMKWINQCISDNRNEPGGTPPVVRAYCVCMNEKMDSNETRSITQWEKSNPGARKDCERQANWK